MLGLLIKFIQSLLAKDMENKQVITLDAYFTSTKTGADLRVKYGSDYTNEILQNATKLLEKVNALLSDLGIISCTINSGWRPAAYNASIGGAPKSYHVRGMAIDLTDKTGQLDQVLSDRPELLKKYDLWREDSGSTPGWCHLDCGVRTDRPSRSFKP